MPKHKNGVCVGKVVGLLEKCVILEATCCMSLCQNGMLP